MTDNKVDHGRLQMPKYLDFIQAFWEQVSQTLSHITMKNKR